ncbi:DNA translocase FtsK [hydrothermal vent metagenome]|uniref:DNA translocase FtsK n=1 Tax=hydrothermal vent metagenome TaxID=652676 RepID=A0A3B0YA80_9ZZZZ
MAQAKRKKQTTTKKKATVEPKALVIAKGVREGVLLFSWFVAVYLVISLITYSQFDISSFSSGSHSQILNYGGKIGAWVAYLMLLFIGYLAYMIPVVVIYLGWIAFRTHAYDDPFDFGAFVARISGFTLTTVSAAALAYPLFFVKTGQLPITSAGGVLGQTISLYLQNTGILGATLVLLVVFLTGLTLLTGISWLTVMDALGRWTISIISRLRHLSAYYAEWKKLRAVKHVRKEAVKEEKKKAKIRKQVIIKTKPRDIVESKRVEKEKQYVMFDRPPSTELPPLQLLDDPVEPEQGYSAESLEIMSRQVELKLLDFGVEATVEAVFPGPVVTLFELELAPGVKVSQVSNLAKDLARALSAIAVRVVEVIPGKSVIGLEIPNEHRDLITLSAVLRSEEYDNEQSPLTIALGKDIGGHPSVVDLSAMPHMLIAGTTGSGKSVAINAMILSLIYKATPYDVRLIMIDPKMLELSVYEGIPHLLTPVVTDMKDAANALRWCVAEMERRYRLMASLGVRNIGGYNRKVKEAIDSGVPLPDPLYKPEEALDPTAPPPTLDHLPYIVVIVDELADMMMSVGKKVEELIARLAQKARAAGVHLILATQRPSVNVITGLIKANIPARIAFQVSAKVDSRTILDQGGADQLLGHGDMLYLGRSSSIPERIHGAFVSDQEVHRVVAHLKEMAGPDYIDSIVSEQTDMTGLLPGEESDDNESDPLYDKAVEIVTRTRRASISSVQRQLKIGYNRAARIMEGMEAAGIVSEMQRNGSREVLAPEAPSD